MRKIFENNQQQQDENKKKPMTREQSEAGNIEKKGGNFFLMYSPILSCVGTRLSLNYSLGFPSSLLSVVVNEKGEMKINELKIIAMTHVKLVQFLFLFLVIIIMK